MLDQRNLLAVVEWVQVATALFVAGNDEELLSRLRRNVAINAPLSHRKVGVTRNDAYDAAALLSFLFSIQFLMHCTITGMLAPSSHILLSDTVNVAGEEPNTNPIDLSVLVVTRDRVGKTFINPSHAACLKGRDQIPE